MYTKGKKKGHAAIMDKTQKEWDKERKDALAARIAELSEKANASDLWDDTANAQAITSALSHAQVIESGTRESCQPTLPFDAQ